MHTQIPLVIDLDGTLIYEDTTIILIKKLLEENPIKIGALIIKLYYGKREFKKYLSSLVKLDIKKLNLNKKLLRWIIDEKKR